MNPIQQYLSAIALFEFYGAQSTGGVDFLKEGNAAKWDAGPDVFQSPQDYAKFFASLEKLMMPMGFTWVPVPIPDPRLVPAEYADMAKQARDTANAYYTKTRVIGTPASTFKKAIAAEFKKAK
jgi:hypothetical protein